MVIQSHRLRVEEKKVYRKLIGTVTGVFVFGFIFIFIGMPFFIKLLASMGSLKKDAASQTNTDENYLFAPVLDTLPEATNSAKITINGYSEKDSNVVILINNKEKAKTLTDKDGKFSLVNITLDEGDNVITAVLKKDDKESNPSSAITITYKKEPPKLEISNPKDGSSYSGEEKDIIISGSTDVDTKIMINDHLSIVDNNGNFESQVHLSDGENKFKVTATDKAGNQTTVEFKVNYRP